MLVHIYPPKAGRAEDLACAGQSGMLAQQDPWTPAALVAVHVSTKLAGNLLFVTWLGMGLAGAAWASVASQWITAVAVSIAVCTKPVRELAPSMPLRSMQLDTFSAPSPEKECDDVKYSQMRAAGTGDRVNAPKNCSANRADSAGNGNVRRPSSSASMLHRHVLI